MTIGFAAAMMIAGRSPAAAFELNRAATAASASASQIIKDDGPRREKPVLGGSPALRPPSTEKQPFDKLTVPAATRSEAEGQFAAGAPAPTPAPGEEELPVWEAWMVTDQMPVLALERGGGREDILRLLPDTYRTSMLKQGHKNFEIRWELERFYDPEQDFILRAEFTGYCPEEDARYEIRPASAVIEEQMETLVHYVDPRPIWDLHGASRTFSTTSISLFFNQIEIPSGGNYSFMPPDAERVYVEYSMDKVHWTACDFAAEETITQKNIQGILLYPVDSIPRYYRIRVEGGCQNGVSNVILLPDDGRQEKPGDEDDGNGSGGMKPPGSHSMGGSGSSIDGNRGGGTALKTPDRDRPSKEASGPGRKPSEEPAAIEDGTNLGGDMQPEAAAAGGAVQIEEGRARNKNAQLEEVIEGGGLARPGGAQSGEDADDSSLDGTQYGEGSEGSLTGGVRSGKESADSRSDREQIGAESTDSGISPEAAANIDVNAAPPILPKPLQIPAGIFAFAACGLAGWILFRRKK